MVILKRIKSGSQVVKYLVKDNGKIFELDAQAVFGVASLVTNATLVSGVDFRAKAGYHIETIQLKDIGIQQRSSLSTVSSNQNTGIDYHGREFISACRKIRDYAKGGKVVVSMDKHVSNDGLNVNMFKLIEACGISVQDFVVGYLSVLQPYSLQKFMANTNIGANNIWVSDIGYRIKMVIKLNDSDMNKPVVVSFHESNIHGKYNQGSVDFSDKLCAVFIDRVEQVDSYYSVDYTIQRGFLRHSVHSTSSYFSAGVALVEYKYIKTRFTDTMTYVFDSLYKVYGDNSNPYILKDLSLNRLSFMAQGYDTVNNICYLIDLYSMYTDIKSRTVFVEVVLNLISEVPDERLSNIRTVLIEKYGDFDNKLYLAVIGG